MTDAPLPNLTQIQRDHLQNRYEVYPVHTNRASQIGHDCARYLTYLRRDWEKMALPSTTLMAIFSEGRLHERAVIALLGELGFQVVESQRAFHDRPHQISGSIDGQILMTHNGTTETVPFDCKSMSSHTYDALHSVEDIAKHSALYVRMWRSQLVMYCYLMAKPRALLIAKNKATGEIKGIEIPLDYEHAEQLLQRATLVNQHLAQGTLPERIAYNDRICGECPAFALCLPDEALRAGATLVDDAAFQAKLERRAALEVAAKEFAALDDQIKKQAKQTLGQAGECVVGVDWLIRTKSSNRAGFEVKPTTVTTVSIQRLGKAPAQEPEQAA